jgi:hypothetical protein
MASVYTNSENAIVAEDVNGLTEPSSIMNCAGTENSDIGISGSTIP